MGKQPCGGGCVWGRSLVCLSLDSHRTLDCTTLLSTTVTMTTIRRLESIGSTVLLSSLTMVWCVHVSVCVCNEVNTYVCMCNFLHYGVCVHGPMEDPHRIIGDDVLECIP